MQLFQRIKWNYIHIVEAPTHSSILAWRIPWTKELAGYSPKGCKESDTIAWLHTHTVETYEMLSILLSTVIVVTIFFLILTKSVSPPRLLFLKSARQWSRQLKYQKTGYYPWYYSMLLFFLFTSNHSLCSNNIYKYFQIIFFIPTLTA